MKIPLVVTCHGQLRFDHFAKDLTERTYSKMLGSRLLQKTDRVITLSDSDMKCLHSLGVPLEKIAVIPGGVDPDRYNFVQENSTEKFPFEEKQIVLFVGPLLKRKGPHLLVEAIPLVLKEQPDAVFVFVGAGNFREEVEKLSWKLNVQEYTYFTGYISDDQLYHLYQRSSVVALPSFSEGFPYSILDALALSKPVVSTLIPCFREYLSGSALLVPPGDSKVLAYAVMRLLSDKKLAETFGSKGRRLVETCFRWDLVVEKVLDVYHEVLNGR